MSDLARKQSNELTEPRIWTLKQLMTACRERVPVILQQIDQMFADPNLHPSDRMKLMDMVLDRGFGKPNQVVRVSDDKMNAAGGRTVQVYLPDNRRQHPPPTIDAQTLEEVQEAPAQSEPPVAEIIDVIPDIDPLDEIESAEIIPLIRGERHHD
jgi:hypothetical protein